MDGDIDAFRTPCYPFLFAIGDVLIPGNSDKFVVMVQIIVFFLSIVPFNRIMQKIGIARNIALIITMVYALSPTISHYNINTRSEPMALYFVVFWIYCFVDWWKEYKWRNIVGLGLCTLYLVFLRPSFLYLLVAMCFVECVYFLSKQYKRFVHLGGIVLIVGCAVYVYSKRIEEKTGIFTISTVSTVNDCAIACRIDLFTSDNVANKKIKQRLIEVDSGRDMALRLEDIPIRELSDEIQRIKSRYRRMWYQNCIKSNVVACLSEHTVTYSNDWLSLRAVSLFLCGAGVYIIYVWLRSKRVSIVALMLWLMCVGNLCVNILGSFAEWNRLFLPSYPVILILIAMCCNLFKIKLNQRALRASEECN
jgi:hypothetical protein